MKINAINLKNNFLAKKEQAVVQQTYLDGTPKTKLFPDGKIQEYSESGQLTTTIYPNGEIRKFYEYPQKSFQSFENGSWKSFYPNGNIYFHQQTNGTLKEYNQNGKNIYTSYPDGSETEYLGDFIFERKADGTWRYLWSDNKKIAAQKLEDKTKQFFYRDGSIKYELTPEDEIYDEDTIELIYSLSV